MANLTDSERNPYKGYDEPGYWNVIGDGWNPGHKLDEEEKRYYHCRLMCFTPGHYDFARDIIWKYHTKPRVPHHATREEIGEYLMALAAESIKPLHEVEYE